MTIQEHILVDHHIIGCSPVTIGENGFKLEIYASNGMHVFEAQKIEELEEAYNYIKNIESFYK